MVISMNQKIIAAPQPKAATTDAAPSVLKADVSNFDFYYGDFHALKKINMPIYENKVTSLIGPSGCGKSTLLRCFNRMHDL